MVREVDESEGCDPDQDESERFRFGMTLGRRSEALRQAWVEFNLG